MNNVNNRAIARATRTIKEMQEYGQFSYNELVALRNWLDEEIKVSEKKVAKQFKPDMKVTWNSKRFGKCTGKLFSIMGTNAFIVGEGQEWSPIVVRVTKLTIVK